MKLKYILSALAIFSSTAFANSSHNLNTVIHSGNIDKIVTSLIDLFNVGVLDESYPIRLTGSYELDSNNKLVSINVQENSFRIKNIPLLGTYQTTYSLTGTVPNGNCKVAVVTSHNIIDGSPSVINPIFYSLMKSKGDKAVRLAIKNSGLNAYCNNTTRYILQID